MKKNTMRVWMPLVAMAAAALQGCFDHDATSPEANAPGLTVSALVDPGPDVIVEYHSGGSQPAIDVGAANGGWAWIVTTTPNTGGYRTKKLNTSTWQWSDMGGGTHNIAIGASIPYVTNSAGNLYYYSSGWHGVSKPMPALDIGVSPTNAIAIVGYDGGAGPCCGGPVYERTPAGAWSRVGDIRARQISFTNNWMLVVTDIDRRVRQYNYSTGVWDYVGYMRAKDVGVTADGRIWVVSEDESAGNSMGAICVWDPRISKWRKIYNGPTYTPIAGIRISAGYLPDERIKHHVWYVGWDNRAYHIRPRDGQLL